MELHCPRPIASLFFFPNPQRPFALRQSIASLFPFHRPAPLFPSPERSPLSSFFPTGSVGKEIVFPDENDRSLPFQPAPTRPPSINRFALFHFPASAPLYPSPGNRLSLRCWGLGRKELFFLRPIASLPFPPTGQRPFGIRHSSRQSPLPFTFHRSVGVQ